MDPARSSGPSDAAPDCSIGELPLQNTPTAMQAGHHGPDRNVEDLGGIGVAEVADVDEHEHVAEVVRDLRQRSDGIVLGEPPVDTFLVRLAGLLELVVEEVVA